LHSKASLEGWAMGRTPFEARKSAHLRMTGSSTSGTYHACTGSDVTSDLIRSASARDTGL